MGGVESTKVTAGLAGFVVLFCLAIACWLLFRSMNKHLRNVRWRQEEEQREAEERAAAERGLQGGDTASGARPGPESAESDGEDTSGGESGSGGAGGSIDRE